MVGVEEREGSAVCGGEEVRGLRGEINGGDGRDKA